MSSELALWLSVGAGAIALIYGAISVKWILGKSAGNERMQEIAGAIQEGARAFLNRQYRTIAMVGVVLAVVIALLLGPIVAVGFVIGAVLSGAAGYLGMIVSLGNNDRRIRIVTGQYLANLGFQWNSVQNWNSHPT